MSLTDSSAAFKKRCDELKVGLSELFAAKGIDNFSTLAFAVGSPQVPATEADLQTFANDIIENATLGDSAIVKRLHFEATTLLLADLKSQVTQTDASEPVRKLPFIEKQSRLAEQQKRITGLSHRGDQQPAHSLIDAAFHIVETGAITYIAPSKCHSRDMEIQGEAKTKLKQVLTIEQGALKSQAGGSLPDVDMSSEIKLFFALQRRALAFELVALSSWNVMQEWINKLMTSLMSEPPPGFTSISLQQLLRADRELFSILAAEVVGSLKAIAGGEPPLDSHIKRMLHDPRINVHLTSLPKLGGLKRDASRDASPKRLPQNKKVKVDKGPAQLPSELQGLKTQNADGKPMCWHFNLDKKCNNPVKKGRCKFGFHQCMKCLRSNHGASECKAH